MTFSIKKKTKSSLAAKTAARRRHHAAETELAALACSPTLVNDLVPLLKLERVQLGDLAPAKRRVRKADKNHVKNLAHSIKTAGQIAPIIIDRHRRIVDGHVVVEALRQLGESHVNVICVDHLNDDQIRYLQVTLNKLADGSVWDLGELRLQLDELQVAGFDLTTTGFSLPELDIILQPPPEEPAPDAEEVPEASLDPVSRLSDVWILGEHCLLCGDALQATSYAQVLAGRMAQASFTDCPWNIPIAGFVSSKHADFKMGVGEMADAEFQTFIDTFTKLIAANIADGAVLYSCIDWRSHDKIILAGERAGLTHINTIVWNKGVGGMGGLYRSAHEFIPLFCKGKTPQTNNVELGRHGRDRTNVWAYAGANRPGSSAGSALKHHPTPKPLDLVEDAILDVTNPGAVVLDPFLGSGTTLLAAERCGRVAAGIELDPAYVDVCIRRWEEMSGKSAVLADTGQTFREIEAERMQATVNSGEVDHDK